MVSMFNLKSSQFNSVLAAGTHALIIGKAV